MAGWRLPRRMPGPPAEVPEWVRSFDPAAWSEPDEQERTMGELPPDIRRWHAERRWHLARNAWYRQHREADFRLEERIARLAQRRARLGRP
jgi:hypothetical protein